MHRIRLWPWESHLRESPERVNSYLFESLNYNCSASVTVWKPTQKKGFLPDSFWFGLSELTKICNRKKNCAPSEVTAVAPKNADYYLKSYLGASTCHYWPLSAHTVTSRWERPEAERVFCVCVYVPLQSVSSCSFIMRTIKSENLDKLIIAVSIIGVQSC